MFPEQEKLQLQRELRCSHRRWQRDGRSIDGSEANEVKIWRMSPDGEPVGSGKGGKKNNARSPTISWKKYFSDGISPQRAETRLFKFHRDTSLSLSIKLQTSRKIIE